MRGIDGAVVDHGDEGHRHVDPHRVDVGEAEERQEGEEMAFAEKGSFVCKADLIRVQFLQDLHSFQASLPSF